MMDRATKATTRLDTMQTRRDRASSATTIHHAGYDGQSINHHNLARHWADQGGQSLHRHHQAGHEYVAQPLVECWCQVCLEHVSFRHVTNRIAGGHLVARNPITWRSFVVTISELRSFILAESSQCVSRHVDSPKIVRSSNCEVVIVVLRFLNLNLPGRRFLAAANLTSYLL